MPADADVVAAVTGDDEDNLVISLLAKQEFGVPRCVARVNNPNNEWMFNDMWGVDMSVSTPAPADRARRGGRPRWARSSASSLEGGKARLAEVTLGGGLTGDRRRDRAARPAPRVDGRRAAPRRPRRRAARGDTVLRLGDEVLVLVTGGAEDDVRRALVG